MPILSLRLRPGLICALAATLLTACEKRKNAEGEESWHFIGQPKEENRFKTPAEITDFHKLYAQNCLACHSNGPETVSASIALDNPDYLATIPPETLRSIVENGVPGTLMPGFAIPAGGTLTEEQITILVDGILAKKSPAADPAIPAYAAPLGDAAAGKALWDASVYAQRDGKPVSPGKSFLNSHFLGTVSDQYVRTLLIVGLPSLGYPDFRGVVPGRVLTTQDVSDLTAWVVSNRRNEYGQPISAPTVGNPAEAAAPNSSATQSVP